LIFKHVKTLIFLQGNMQGINYLENHREPITPKET